MKIRQLSLIAVLAAILLIGGAWLAQFKTSRAPEVHFKTLTGEQFSTRDLRGKVVLVNFWATTCVSCVDDMQHLIETQNRYKAQGFETVAVAMDYDPPNRVLDFAQKHQLPFKVSLDIDGSVAKAFGNVRLTPVSFLIDRRGHVVRRYLGQPDFVQLDALVQRKLREPA
jgi:peroxiredoxin